MSTNHQLPIEFQDLEPFVAEWALTNERDRLAKLLTSSIAELRVFYDAMIDRADDAAAYLTDLPIDAMPDDAKALFYLTMTFVETAHPIELRWSHTDIDDAFPLERITFGPASLATIV